MVCEDGLEYVVRPFEWTAEAVEKYWPRFFKFGIFSDDVPTSLDGFVLFALAGSAVWFEIVRTDTGENVGFIYLTDLLRSPIEKRYLSASWHAVVWDHSNARRKSLARAAIKEIFRLFRLHRLVASIPLKFSGAIRIAKSLGFQHEGVMRSARRYKGVWFGVLLLSILEDEVLDG